MWNVNNLINRLNYFLWDSEARSSALTGGFFDEEVFLMHCLCPEQPGTHFTFLPLASDFSASAFAGAMGLYSIVASFLVDGLVEAGIARAFCACSICIAKTSESVSNSLFILK